MIKIKHFESICMYLPISVVSILLAAQVRISFINKGLDEFTANIFFVVVIFVGAVIYAGLNLFLHTLYDIVNKLILKRRQSFLINQSNSEISSAKHITEKIKAEEIKVNDHLEIALNYTQQQFALYTSKEDLKKLCEYVNIYSKNGNIKDIIPVTVHTLSNTDLYHFGWNIWKHFDKRNQFEIALFLKSVFANSLKDVETTSIKSHLRDDENNGIIMLKKDITA